MKFINYSFFRAAAVALLVGSSMVQARISEPDHIIYGTATFFGDMLAEGSEITVLINSDLDPVATYIMGEEPALGPQYALRLPMDSVDPRSEGKARAGDSAAIYIDGTLAGTATVGERGVTQRLDIDPATAILVPGLFIDDPEVIEGDAGSTQLVFTISVNQEDEDPVTVDWATTADTASGVVSASCVPGADYLSDFGTAVINPGDPGNATTVTISVCGDLDAEADEQFFVDLSNASANVQIVKPRGAGGILDDDTPPTIAVNDLTIVEPPTGSTMAQFRVSLSHLWDQNVRVNYATSGGSATPGADFLSTSGQLTIDAGSLEGSVFVDVLADTAIEPNEDFFLDLSNPVNGTILDGSGRAEIVDAAQTVAFQEIQQDGVGGVTGMANPFVVAVSPDGDHVYVGSRGNNALVMFERLGDGTLNFLMTYDINSTDFGTGLFDGLSGLAFSDDGNYLYTSAADDNGVMVLERDANDVSATYGELTLRQALVDGDQLPGEDPIDGLEGASALALSPDQDFLYVVGADDNAVAAFNRSAVDGRLSFLEFKRDGDQSVFGDTIDGLAGASDIAISADGASVYISGPLDDGLAVFDRETTNDNNAIGRLSWKEVQKDGVAGVDGLDMAIAVIMDPSDTQVLVAGREDNGIAIFDRAGDGSLSFNNAVINGVNGVQGLTGALDLAVSADGEYFYSIAFEDDAMAVFLRNIDMVSPNFGQLTQLEVKYDDVGGVDGLWEPTSLAISGDDEHIYVTGQKDNAVAVFTRDRVAPNEPTTLISTSHQVGVWSNNPIIDLEWSGATDNGGGAGLAGYSFLFDLNPMTLPDRSVDQDHGTDPQMTSSSALPDNDMHFFHLRTCDNARNCSTPAQDVGPFLIDTLPPQNATNVASTSHMVGVPNMSDVISMQWTGGVDVGVYQSGFAGYSYVFNTDPTSVCNLEVDLGPAAGNVDSDPLIPGVWYFHICAGDFADNFTPATTVGPFIVGSDGLPPRVFNVNSVVGPAGGTINEGDGVNGGVTQLLLTFSEPMQDLPGTTSVGDVDNPAGYLLVSAGPDEMIETVDCQTIVGDDVQEPILSVDYDDGAFIAGLILDDGVGLIQDQFRIFACADGSLLDLEGNALDGDGDGIEGDDFSRSFGIDWSNLTRNPNFDAPLTGVWSLSNVVDMVGQDADVQDAHSSGSLVINRELDGERNHAVSQCVGLAGGDMASYQLRGFTRITELVGGDPGDPTSVGALTFFGGPGCGGGQIGSEVFTNPVVDDTSGAWAAMEIPLIVPPIGAQSALVSFSASIPPTENFPYAVEFDALRFQWLMGSVIVAGPPAIERVTAVARPSGGELSMGHRTQMPVTQIEVQFTESMFDPVGNVQANDVENPASYLFVAAGANGMVDSGGCSVAVGDDITIVPDSIEYNDATRSAVMMLPGGLSLDEGEYALRMCQTMTDLEGEVVVIAQADQPKFSMDASNLLGNPNLDGNLGSWLPQAAAGSQFLGTGDDVDTAESSGSAFLSNNSGANAVHQLEQCQPIPAGVARLRLDGQVRAVVPGSAQSVLMADVEFFNGAGCGGSSLGSFASNLINGDSGGWSALTIPGMAVPVGAQSVRASFVIDTGSGDGNVTVNLDRLTLRYGSTLFSDSMD